MPEIDLAAIRYVEPDQFKSILDAIDDNAGRFRRRQDEFKPWLPLALRTYRATGARPAEVVGRSGRPRRVEEEGYVDQGTIQEHHGLRARDVHGEHQLLLEGKNTMGGRARAKGLKARIVTCADPPLHRELQDLAAGFKDQDQHLFGLGPSPRQHGDGYWQLTRQIQKLRPFLDPALQEFQTRWLRHSWAIHALRGGVDLVTIQRQLGHTRVDITAIYLRFCPTDRKKVIRAFNPEPPKPEHESRDCPGCGFGWKVDASGKMLLEDRMNVALMRRRR